MSVPMHILPMADQPDSQATILQSIRDSVIATDLRGRILYWNEGAQSIFGYSAEEMVGQTAVRLYPEQDPNSLLPLYKRSAKVKLVMKNGEAAARIVQLFGLM
jgi:PAS domain S-box-containing protein